MYNKEYKFGTSNSTTFGNKTPTFGINSNNSFGLGTHTSNTPNAPTLNSFGNIPNTSTLNSFGNIPNTPTLNSSTPNTSTLNSFAPNTSTLNSFGNTPNTSTFNSSTPNTFENTLNSRNFGSLNQIQKVECQVSLKLDKETIKNSLDEIVIKPRLSKIKDSDINLITNFTKDISVKCCTVMISNDPKQLIKNSLIGGVSIIKDYTKIDIIKQVQNFVRFVNTEPIVINHNCLLSQLYETYRVCKPECIYVVNESNKCIGMVVKNDIEIALMIGLDANVLVFQIMKPIDNYFLESEYNWEELMTTVNSEMLSRFRNVKVIPIVNTEEQVVGEFSLDNLSNYYKRKNTILFNKKGKIFVGVQITIDNHLEIDNLVNKGVNLVYIESNNVYNERVCNMIKELKSKYPLLVVMIGKVLTGDTYKYFSESGVDCISVGDSSEIGHLNKLYECKLEYKNHLVPIISNSGTIKDSNIYKVLVGGANCVLISELSDNTITTIKTNLASINVDNIESLYDENIEIYKYV